MIRKIAYLKDCIYWRYILPSPPFKNFDFCLGRLFYVFVEFILSI